MQPKHFAYSEAEGVASLRLDRPERLNALTFASYRELTDTFRALQSRSEVRAVVLTGTGRAFCSGGDVQDIIGRLFERSPAEVQAFTRMTCDLIESMRLLEKPIVAALNGVTCGAGAVMALAADVRIGCPAARIAFLFTKVGLSGADMGAAWLLPRIVGLGHASELLMTGDFIDAERAREIGLYNQVVPADSLLATAERLAAKLARGPSMGLAVTKRALNLEASMTLREAMQFEGWIQAECMAHKDYWEGYLAAREKRAPDFSYGVLPPLEQPAGDRSSARAPAAQPPAAKTQPKAKSAAMRKAAAPAPRVAPARRVGVDQKGQSRAAAKQPAKRKAANKSKVKATSSGRRR